MGRISAAWVAGGSVPAFLWSAPDCLSMLKRVEHYVCSCVILCDIYISE